MRAAPALPEALRAARRALEGAPGVTLLSDWRYLASAGRFTLPCRLRAQVPAESLVPAETDWWVLASEAYPYGEIVFYPDRGRGLRDTFPHQAYNAELWQDRPYRSGRLCLTQNYHAARTRPDEHEPYSAEGRLHWHIERAQRWLQAAAEGHLTAPGEPFLPPASLVHIGANYVYSEGREHLTTWQEQPARCGLLSLLSSFSLPGLPLRLVGAFGAPDGAVLRTVSWGHAIAHMPALEGTGLWLRLDQLPVLPPWRAPHCYGELREACRRQRLDLDQMLRLLLPGVGGGLQRPFLIGAPVPLRHGEAPARMHFLALLLPPVPTRAPDPRELLPDAAEIAWLPTSNWHPELLGARGRLEAHDADAEYLLIGAGALGSALAELLVRAGHRRLHVIDHDPLQPGNLVRHTLGLPHLLLGKALGLSVHLNQASPHAAITGTAERFPPREEALRRQLANCPVIIDTTGDDEVIAQLAAFPWGGPRLFLSLSLGFGARRLFAFAACGERFPEEAFRAQLAPWLAREYAERTSVDEEASGGCRDPFFPGRSDDVWMLAASGLKLFEAWLRSPPTTPTLTVLSQRVDTAGFAGIERLPPLPPS